MPMPHQDIPRPRGRPRSPDRDQAILEATLELLETFGYDQLRVQQIAHRAGVGLGAIYRRWPTKQILVVDVIRFAGSHVTAVPSTGDPRQDLLAVIVEVARQMRGTSKAFLPGLLTAFRTEPEITAVVQTEIVNSIRTRFREVLGNALGEAVPDRDLRIDIAPALLFFRLLLTEDTENTDQLALEITDLLLGPPSPTRRRSPAKATGNVGVEPGSDPASAPTLVELGRAPQAPRACSAKNRRISSAAE